MCRHQFTFADCGLSTKRTPVRFEEKKKNIIEKDSSKRTPVRFEIIEEQPPYRDSVLLSGIRNRCDQIKTSDL